MSVSLRELYNSLDSAHEIVLVAGQQGLDHPVRWVHMVEGIDITLFLEGDEVAFTTGIALGSMDDLIHLVRCTYERGAAGMVINVGPYIDRIPQKVIDFGNEAGFPIFRVPWRVHMANIMREFAMQITRQETVEMEIETAFDNAISQPENTKLYLPVILKHGYQKEWTYCVVLIEMESQVAENQMQKYLVYAQRDFYTRDKYTVAYQKDNCFVLIFVNTSELQIKEQISTYLMNLRKYFNSKIHACVGIGDKSADLEGLSTSFAEAKYVLKLCKRMESGSKTSQKFLNSQNHLFLQKEMDDSKNEIIAFRELGVYRLLFATDRHAAEKYYQEVLGPLAVYDRANGTDNLYFLREYFAHDCSVQETAECFHLHRNSVAYRLSKIEEIIGMPLHTNAARAQVILAFQIKTVLDISIESRME